MTADVFEEAERANDRLGIGGNSMFASPEELAAEHAARVDELIGAANAWVALVGTVTSAADAERLEAYITQLRADRGAVETARKEAKKPYDDGAAAVQAAFTPIVGRIDACGIVVKKLKEAWLDREDRRIKAEAEVAAAAARQAEEEAQAAAAAAAATQAGGLPNAVETVVLAEETQQRATELAAQAQAAATAKPMVRSGLTGRATGFTRIWKATIDDPVKVAQYFAERREPKLMEVLQGLANREAKNLHQNLSIPGATPIEERRV